MKIRGIFIGMVSYRDESINQVGCSSALLWLYIINYYYYYYYYYYLMDIHISYYKIKFRLLAFVHIHVQCQTRFALKVEVVGDKTTSSGKEFQVLITLWVKKFDLNSNRDCLLNSFMQWPLVLWTELRVKYLGQSMS